MFGIKKKSGSPRAVTRGGRKKKKGSRRHAGPYSPEQRRQAVEAYLKSGMSQADFAKTWGTSSGSLFNWVKVYRARGPQGLENEIYLQDGKKRGRKGLPAVVKDRITAVKAYIVQPPHIEGTAPNVVETPGGSYGLGSFEQESQFVS